MPLVARILLLIRGYLWAVPECARAVRVEGRAMRDRAQKGGLRRSGLWACAPLLVLGCSSAPSGDAAGNAGEAGSDASQMDGVSGGGGSAPHAGANASASAGAGGSAIGSIDAGEPSTPPPKGPSDGDETFEVPEGSTCYPHALHVEPGQLCPLEMCGNALIDECEAGMACPGQPGPQCVPIIQHEECDGDELVERSCETMGFAGGTLRCSSSCRLDWSGCNVCGDDPRIEACVRVEATDFAETGQTLAVASNGERAAIAWPAQSDASSVGRLRFALVNDDLTLTASDCFEEEQSNWSPYLAANPLGWMLAYRTTLPDSTPAVQLVVLDEDGTLDSKPTASIAGVPLGLVQRENAGPLLLYSVPLGVAGETVGAMMAALLDARGQAMWTARLADATDIQDVAAVYTGDGFLWASRRSLGAEPLFVRLELDGTMSSTVVAIGEDNLFPQLAWTGSEVRMFWESSFIALDPQGIAQGSTTSVIDEPASQPRPAQLADATAVLLLTGTSDPVLGGLYGDGAYSGQHELVTVGADGTSQPPFTVFANGNQGPNFQPQLVVVKDRLLAAAHTRDQRYGHSIHLAWIRP